MSHGLHNLAPAKGSNTKKKRLGRGPGSGLGKTSARGGKGQTARKGGGIRFGFEGGQTPLYRRLPKRGFFNVHSRKPAVLRLSDLNKFKDGEKVSVATLIERKMISAEATAFKVIATGKLERKVTLVGGLATEGARKAISQAGGSFAESSGT